MSKPTTAAQARRRAFAEHVAAGKSATEAARLVGYKGTKHAVEVTGSRLLKHAEVRAVIEEARKASTSDRVATATQLKEFWTDVANGKVLDQGGPAKLSDRIRAAELLGKVQGLFVEVVKNDGKLEITVRRGGDAPAALPPKENS